MAADVPNSLNWLSFVTGILGFALTTLNLIALYANFVATIRAAPSEIRDSLGNLRQQLCEEREALRHQTKEIRAKSKLRQKISHIGEKNANAEARRALEYAEKTLPLHYMTLRDLWRTFKELERPFLVASGHRAEAIHNGASWGENDLDEKVRSDFEKHGEMGSFADWSALYKCDFAHRFIWWQVKDSVKKLGDEVMRVMARRTEREVTYTRMMVRQMYLGDVHGQGSDRGTRRPGDGGGGGGARRRMSWGSSVPAKRRTPQPRYEESSSSSSGQSSDDNSRTTRRGSGRGRDTSPVFSEHRMSHPRSDAATVGKHRYNSGHRREHSRGGWQGFRTRADRAYEIREMRRGRGQRIIEVIPGSEIDDYPRARQQDEEK
ncbi:hypothetical protein GCG54_00009493 [Colletotrichum gloeosporioides]|uniref:Uncharacterized protein n=1 Tax=Colletotrichum gloeosporioides TaxID=474922 RepID=A0A8H4FFW0_COLGL|nr:uncharacterized protein GCG54_00009493 [Colletotrichum gloeosporioides]KAF3800822.1 hypothetical protein GCG54_00009493 [Colletotrichum gloeosporioides]